MGSERVVVLVDMDCFYCQVEEGLRPELRGQPLAVVQYNQWQGGGIIAVNYLARAKGVTRHMRGDEAKKQCPDLQLASVPSLRGKADISRYREAGKKVAHVLQEFTPLLERASVDEAYLDITQPVNSRINDYMQMNSISKDILPNTYILGYDDLDGYLKDVFERSDIDCEMADFDRNHSIKLLVGAVIVSEIRAEVYKRTGYQCSAGIAHNKIMAKLVCGMNKPNKQTVLPKNRIMDIFETLPINKIRSLGGKFGENVCKRLKISTMKELISFSEPELQKYFDEKNGSFLYKIAHGIDDEPVTPRFSSKSIGCCKKFPGKGAIVDLHTLKHWLHELGSEIEDRLTIDFTENNRHPTQMVVSYTKEVNKKEISCSRSVNMAKCDITSGELLSKTALDVIKKEHIIAEEIDGDENIKPLNNPIKFLGISVGKFENVESEKNTKGIQHFFNKNTNVPIKSNSNIPQKDDTLVETIASNVDEAIASGSNQTNDKPIPKDSFIMRYLKTFKPNRELLYDDNSNSNDIPYINENSNSNISENSIDPEINTADDNPEVDNKSDHRENRNSFSILKFFNNQSESTDIPDDDDVDNSNPNTKIHCEQCDQYIYETDISTHNDYHFAKAIREEEHRKNSNKTIEISKNNSILPKKIKPTAKIANNSNILTLFNKINYANNYTVPDSEAPCEICNECGKSIPLIKFPEHADFHEAKRLHETLNKSHSTQFKISSENPNKRKVKIQTDNNKSKKNNHKPINSYFNT